MTEREFVERFSFDVTTDLLGEGGFGSVYRAYDNFEHEYVALKMQDVNPQYRELRLRNEYEKVQQFTHPYIARYKACYTLKTFKGETDIAVMKYYEAGSLDKLIAKGTLSFEQRCIMLEHILEGVGFLHSRGIIHRDLKPQNILIVEHAGKYVPLITDFGISKQLDEGQSSAVSNSVLGGTRNYASPEQLKEATIRKNTDLWSFGIIAYQMFTGTLPFNCGTYSPTSEEGRSEYLRQVKSGILPDALNGVPEPWQTLIRACLVVDSDRRIAHAEDCISICQGNIDLYSRRHEYDINVSVDEGDTILEDDAIVKSVFSENNSLLGYLENVRSINALCSKLNSIGFEFVKELAGNFVYAGKFLDTDVQILIMKDGFDDTLRSLHIISLAYDEWKDCKQEYMRIKEGFTREYGTPLNLEFLNTPGCDGSGREFDVLENFDDVYGCQYNLYGARITMSVIIGRSSAVGDKPVGSTRIHYEYNNI